MPVSDKLVVNSIEISNCVLILGPFFGLNNQGIKIHKIVREQLDDNFSLDDEYQNLFILKQSPDNDWIVFSTIADLYENVVPSEVYDKVARINFSAMLTFTQDIFLLNAIKKQNVEFIFKYFSANNSKQKEDGFICQSQQNSINTEKNNIPVVYNLFGSYQDFNSLIINYNSFYKFLFAILGNDKTFPQEVITKLAEAQVFVFLGFDLKKWYVPLIFSKFFNLGRDNSNPNRPMAVASLNDTDTSNDEYMQWLKRYPLKIDFLEGSSYEVVDRLSAVANEKIFRKPCKQASPAILFYDDPEFQKNREDFLNEIGKAGNEDNLISVIEEIRTFFSERNYKDAETYMVNIKGRLNNYISRTQAGVVANTTELNEIRNSLSTYINH
jgi:hypothetical protein